MIGLVSGSWEQLDGQVAGVDGQRAGECDSWEHEYNIAKQRVLLLVFFQMLLGLLRLHTRTTELISNDRGSARACHAPREIVVAPGLIPVGMTIDDQDLASGNLISDAL